MGLNLNQNKYNRNVDTIFAIQKHKRTLLGFFRQRCIQWRSFSKYLVFNMLYSISKYRISYVLHISLYIYTQPRI